MPPPKTTDELLKILNDLRTSPALNDFTEKIGRLDTVSSFPAYLEDLLQKSGLSPSELICASQIQRNYGYQILNGTKRPGRDKVVALCLALKLPLEETQRALTLAQEGALYPKNRRDSVLIFCINNKKSVGETNELLYDLGEKTL